MSKNNKYDDIEEDEDYNQDELIELNNVRKSIEKNIKQLWTEVIAKYIEFCDESQILGDLSPEQSYDKFYAYMIRHNSMYSNVINVVYLDIIMKFLIVYVKNVKNVNKNLNIFYNKLFL